ncbi:MAG: sulfotransferase [Pirellulaceae bacterium]|nr:sulfotransferase [Pirellulaceae bacterium]
MVHQHPNLFVIGAPKCGTSSLYAYLRQHPQVYMAKPKEPNHFVYSSGNPYGWGTSHPYSTLDAYLSLFRATGDQGIVGEASTCYCLMPHVARAIRNHNPEAKLIAVLRDPVERAWSMYLYWHQFNPQYQRLDLDDFRARFVADDLMTDLERGRSTRVKWLRGAGMYWANLSHFYSEFPADQIFLLNYDDFVRQPQRMMDQLCEFLGVSSYTFDTSVRENTTAVPRFRRLYNFVNLNVEHPLRRALKNTFGKLLPMRTLRLSLNQALLSVQAQRTLPDSLYHELGDFYRDDLKRLADHTGFPVRQWTRLGV